MTDNDNSSMAPPLNLGCFSNHGLHLQQDKKATISFVISMPEKKGNWSFSIKFQIADAGGGDFVLSKDTNDGLITILSDVMGHDTEAKFFAYTYAGYLRSLFKNNPNTDDGSKFLNYLLFVWV